MTKTDCCVLLFSKPARPGLVKTRLIGELTPRQAARLHDAFFQDLVARLERGRFTLRVAWALPRGERLPPGPVAGLRQRGRGLGERLYNALREAGASFRWVAAVGSDHPELELSLVHQAFDMLAGGADVVLGPAVDGGYYLIGVPGQDPRRELFEDVAWSTPTVLATTLDRCRRIGLRPALLPVAADVDSPLDLERLTARLRRTPLIDCPRTRALLASWGRLELPFSEGEGHENP